MFDSSFYWYLGFFGAMVIITILSDYKTKNLPPKQKALKKLFYSLVIFGGLTVFLIFNLLSSGDFTYVSEELNTLDEAQKVLQEHNESIGNLKFTTHVFLLFVLMGLLPSIYNFAKAITPIDEERKPIFGLNDE